MKEKPQPTSKEDFEADRRARLAEIQNFERYWTLRPLNEMRVYFGLPTVRNIWDEVQLEEADPNQALGYEAGIYPEEHYRDETTERGGETD